MTQIADHSYLSTVLECPRKFYYRYERHLSGLEPSIPMIVGSGIHKAMEVLYGDGFHHADRAIEACLDYVRDRVLLPPSGRYDFMSEGHLEVILRNYVAHWGDDPYKVVYSVENPIVHTGIGIGGIPDLVVEDQNGERLVMDHKSTTSYLGDSLRNRTKFQQQGRIYCLLTNTAGVVFNAIYTGKAASSSSSKAVKFDRWRFDYTEKQLEETKEWIKWTSFLVTDHYEDNNPEGCVPGESLWPQNGGQQCGWCSYAPLCEADPDFRESIIESQYVVKEPKGMLLSGADDD